MQKTSRTICRRPTGSSASRCSPADGLCSSPSAIPTGRSSRASSPRGITDCAAGGFRDRADGKHHHRKRGVVSVTSIRRTARRCRLPTSACSAASSATRRAGWASFQDTDEAAPSNGISCCSPSSIASSPSIRDEEFRDVRFNATERRSSRWTSCCSGVALRAARSTRPARRCATPVSALPASPIRARRRDQRRRRKVRHRGVSVGSLLIEAVNVAANARTFVAENIPVAAQRRPARAPQRGKDPGHRQARHAVGPCVLQRRRHAGEGRAGHRLLRVEQPAGCHLRWPENARLR